MTSQAQSKREHQMLDGMKRRINQMTLQRIRLLESRVRFLEEKMANRLGSVTHLPEYNERFYRTAPINWGPARMEREVQRPYWPSWPKRGSRLSCPKWKLSRNFLSPWQSGYPAGFRRGAAASVGPGARGADLAGRAGVPGRRGRGSAGALLPPRSTAGCGGPGPSWPRYSRPKMSWPSPPTPGSVHSSTGSPRPSRMRTRARWPNCCARTSRWRCLRC